MSNLKPFWCYYGGKYRIAPKYPKPKYDTIIEPFAGAAGYSTRYHWKNVILYDADEIIVSLWEYLINVSVSEIESLPLHVPESVEELDVCREAKYLIGWWLNKGTQAPCKSPSTWFKSGMYPNSHWGEVIRQRIADQVPKIRHWRIFHGTYNDAPNIRATWFVDPPYMEMGRHYRCSSTSIDFADLAEFCKKRVGQTIVCENDGATWLPFKPLLVNAGRVINRSEGRRKSVESIYYMEN